MAGVDAVREMGMPRVVERGQPKSTQARKRCRHQARELRRMLLVGLHRGERRRRAQRVVTSRGRGGGGGLGVGVVEPFQVVRRRREQVHGHGSLLSWLNTWTNQRLRLLLLLVGLGLGLRLRRQGRGGTRGQGRQGRRGALLGGGGGGLAGLFFFVQVAYVHFLVIQDRGLGGGEVGLGLGVAALFHWGGGQAEKQAEVMMRKQSTAYTHGQVESLSVCVEECGRHECVRAT